MRKIVSLSNLSHKVDKQAGLQRSENERIDLLSPSKRMPVTTPHTLQISRGVWSPERPGRKLKSGSLKQPRSRLRGWNPGPSSLRSGRPGVPSPGPADEPRDAPPRSGEPDNRLHRLGLLLKETQHLPVDLPRMGPDNPVRPALDHHEPALFDQTGNTPA